uniref:Uncharacterized protein n=1 Tax=Trypanosoma congolense (strain IL3000) TaxID=1068625 RepID=G0UZC1_TRYCI|nr:conserved hypothetical protein [Trypanosoma congolense IL3000]
MTLEKVSYRSSYFPVSRDSIVSEGVEHNCLLNATEREMQHQVRRNTLQHWHPDARSCSTSVDEGLNTSLNVHVRTRDHSLSNSYPPLLVSSSSTSPLSPFSRSALQDGPLPMTPVLKIDSPLASPSDKAVHRALRGKCRFIRFPAEVPPFEPLAPPAEGGHKLFVGQLRFETSFDELAWFLRNVVHINLWNIEKRGCGCAIVSLYTDADREAMLRLKQRVLLDIDGMWFAQDATEQEHLLSYVSGNLEQLVKRMKLPLRPVVFEDMKKPKTLLPDGQSGLPRGTPTRGAM